MLNPASSPTRSSPRLSVSVCRHPLPLLRRADVPNRQLKGRLQHSSQDQRRQALAGPRAAVATWKRFRVDVGTRRRVEDVGRVCV